MRTSYLKLILSAAAIALLGAGCSANIGTEVNKTEEGLAPKRGTIITIKDCKASPTILQIQANKEIVFKNSDSIEHTLFIDGQNQTLAANGELKIQAKFSLPAPITMNYMCDGKGMGDAIYVTL